MKPLAEVGLKLKTKMYSPDSVMSEFATRYVVVDTKRRRRIKLRAYFTEELVYLCLVHSKTL